ncbi:uncharacterized protein DC041_0008762 [Schistosoma bovis]|uniref:Uncharacterized protein n=1 Tax=Schistosoma bovis TaxID=6184 RepID=A0A430PXQ5_SCHBO|nr:uncharacterized protein DC041_0008762 [Schistosoma bovis]
MNSLNQQSMIILNRIILLIIYYHYQLYNEELKDNQFSNSINKMNLQYQTVLNVAKAAFQYENLILNTKQPLFTNHTILNINEHRKTMKK